MRDYDYALPPEAVAQVPAEPRDAARLLVDLFPSGVEHTVVSSFSTWVRPGDLLVVNETRVIPARLPCTRPTGGAAEVLLLERGDDGWWEALARPARRLPAGTRLDVAPGFAVEVGDAVDAGRVRVRLHAASGDEDAALAAHGAVPLPPYLREPLADPSRYQTVFARRPGSAAAPTAGLHLTAAVLDACRAAGASVATVDLAIGLDTFRPVTAERPEDHVIHTERYRVPEATMHAVADAERVIAVGTTSVRALETAAATGVLEGRSSLFIRRGFRFRAVDVLLTNFHQPRSTLLLLLDAFVGPRWRDLYELALRDGYRFLSFGDAMLVRRAP